MSALTPDAARDRRGGARTTGVAVCALDEVADGAARKFVVDGVAVAVVRLGHDVFAIGDVCSHANVSLSDGEVWCDELELECPKHGSAFNLRTGEPNVLPATQPVPVFGASVVDGQIVVDTSTTEADS